MASYNRVILTGKVLHTLKRRYRPDGLPVVQFSLELEGGENSHRGGKNGSRALIDIVAFGALTESDLLQDGQPLHVIGRLNQRSWQTPEGRRKTCVEVIATELRKAGGIDEKRGK